jgi:C4-dicarboxylate transporter DctM subunit
MDIVLVIISFILILFLIALRIPVAVSLFIAGYVGIWYLYGIGEAIGIVKAIPYDFAASWSLSSLPMYLLMGYFAFHSKMAERIYIAVRAFIGKIKGSLAITTVFGCAFFGAISGSSGATAAAFSKIAIPEMDKDGYNKGLSTGTIAASGTMGALMPPSIGLIIYAVLMEVSIGKVFMAGVLPCILSAIIYAAMIFIRVNINPSLAPTVIKRHIRKERREAVLKLWDFFLVIIVVFGGMYSGLFTATEAGAIGACTVFIIGVITRRLSISSIKAAIVDALVVTSSILIIAVGANIFSRFIALTGLSDLFIEWVRTSDITAFHLMVLIFFMYFIFGMFIDPIGCMLLTLPILLPVLLELNIDLIWFAIILQKNMELALITPPVGLNVYIIKGVVGDVPLETVFKGIFWFAIMDIITLAIIFVFPQISLLLPTYMFE